MSRKFWLCIAGINGFMAIVMGAVAAHALINPEASLVANKASWYQLFHAVVLVALADRSGQIFEIVRGLFLAGIFFFCGTLYLESMTGGPHMTQLAPLGGMSFMVGWLLLIIAAYKEK